MNICETYTEFKDTISAAKANGTRIGFVPTMGALHDGHLSLIDIARQHADFVVVSIFVNPTQFAPGEDFEDYPRNIERDIALLRGAGVDAIYLPDAAQIYPDGVKVTIKAGDAAQGLEGDFRPHFFDGVCSVVHRLFTLVTPDIAVFGEKDYQQLMVIREMEETYNMGIEIIGAPIIRDIHGLALSSRNAYLSNAELGIAQQLNKQLLSLRAKLMDARSNLAPQQQDCRAGHAARLAMTDSLLEHGFDKVDYIEERWGRILAAAWLGKTRLIDNIALKG